MDLEDQRREKQKMTRTEVFQERIIPNSENLTCKQKIIKKIKKNIKPLVFDFQQQTQAKTSNLMVIQVALEHATPKKSFAEEIAEF